MHIFSQVKNKLSNKFGNKEFIKMYWKIATPAFLWAIFISLSPILTNLFIVSVIPHNIFGNNNEQFTKIFNFNIYALSYINILSVVLIMSSFSIIGNLVVKKDLFKLNEIMKIILQLSIIISIIITVFLNIYSYSFENQILGLTNNYNNNNFSLSYGSTFMSWSSISIIFYMMNWFFISSFSILKLTWLQCFSSIIGLIFYLILLSIYSTNIHYSSFEDKKTIIRNYALIYDAWYAFQDILIFGYCYLPYTLKLLKEEKKIKIIKQNNIAYKYFYFLRKWSFKYNKDLFIFFFKYSFWIIIDVIVWVIADIFSQVASVRDPNPGLNNENQNLYNQIILLCTQYTTYLYLFFNGFGFITNGIMNPTLINGGINNSKKYTKYMFWWSLLIGLIIFLLILIVSYELNMYLIGGINSPEKVESTSKYTYRDLWNMAMLMCVIYGLYMFLNIIFNNIYYFQLSGNSRFIVLSDGAISLIYVILTWSLILTHNNMNNIFAWYVLNKSYILWKFIIGLIIIKNRKIYNTIDHPNWIWEKNN